MKYKFNEEELLNLFCAQKAYAALFDQTNGAGAWDDNPWVWCYGLKLIGV